MIKWIFFLLLLPAVVACHSGEGETAETSYLEPLIPEPVYKFSRNGSSSVDILECGFLKEPLDYIYGSYLRQARLSNADMMDLLNSYYAQSQSGYVPEEHVAQSPLAATMRADVLSDLRAIFKKTAEISGYGASHPSEVRNREGHLGRTGYIGNNISDPNLFFVDERGCVVAEVFRNYIMGAVYLNKILNLHLNDSIYRDAEVQRRHLNVVLPAGRNYTEMEHHWDLAYGYYHTFWKSMAQADGLPILKDSHRTIYNAFVYGRTAMQTYQYDEVQKQLRTIKRELSRVVAIRLMNLLLGVNTVANMQEAPEYAFGFISQAMGLVYALPFAANEEGRPLFTRSEALQIISDLTAGNGLWEQERLLGDAEKVGSLLNVSVRVGRPFAITPDDIKR